MYVPIRLFSSLLISLLSSSWSTLSAPSKQPDFEPPFLDSSLALLPTFPLPFIFSSSLFLPLHRHCRLLRASNAPSTLATCGLAPTRVIVSFFFVFSSSFFFVTNVFLQLARLFRIKVLQPPTPFLVFFAHPISIIHPKPIRFLMSLRSEYHLLLDMYNFGLVILSLESNAQTTKCSIKKC